VACVGWIFRIASCSSSESVCSASNQRSRAEGVDGDDGAAWLGAAVAMEATVLDNVDGVEGVSRVTGLADGGGNAGA